MSKKKKKECLEAYDRNVECLEAYDHNDRVVMVGERKKLLGYIRRYSMKHGDANLAVRVVHLFLINSSGELYIVQRGDKDENPYLWDKTLGAHMIFGETYDTGLKRECYEEFGLETAIVEPKNFQWVIKKTDLLYTAVIKQIGFDPWYRTVRTVRKRLGEPWVKRHRAQTYIGVYDGELNYVDGEAINLRKMGLEELEKDIQSNPSIYTHDLADLVQKYRPHLVGPFFE